MSVSYPLSLPVAQVAARIKFRRRAQVGVSVSPFTFSQTVYAHQGDQWLADVELPPLFDAAEAAAWIAFLVSLNGREGTFLMGDPTGEVQRGTWTAPVVHGAHAAGVKTINIRSVDGRTWKQRDWLQFGSGSSSRLHMVVQDGSQVGSPSTGSVEIWPRTRAALSDGAVITLAAAKGVWRLVGNEDSWDVDLAQEVGIAFSCEEAK